MKSKGEKIAFVIAILIIVLMIAAIVGGIKLFIKFINITKDSITTDKFISIMEDNNYKVTNVKNQSKDADIDIKEAYVAKKNNKQIEFYTFYNESDAKMFFRINKEKFDDDYAKTKVSLSGSNYNSFNIEVDGQYKFVERIDKTVIYINIAEEYKPEIKSIVHKLGY